jgi:hypothetical protein
MSNVVADIKYCCSCIVAYVEDYSCIVAYIEDYSCQNVLDVEDY